MIELISLTCKEGDRIRLLYNNNKSSVEGVIFKILPSSIAIMAEEGIVGIKGDDINSFNKLTADEKNQDRCSVGTTDIGEKIDDSIHEDAPAFPRQGQSPNKDNGSNTNSQKAEDVPQDNHQQTPPSKTPDSNKTYGVGEVIPLEELERRTGGKKVKFPNKGGSMTTIGNSLKALEPFVSDTHKKENQQIVPALGIVKMAFLDKNFGFIKDGETGQNLYFSFNEVIDPSLGIRTISHAPVIYSIIDTAQGKKAISIHKPATINELLALSSHLSSNKDYKHAIDVVDHILKEYPDNYSADVQKTQLQKLIPHYNVGLTNSKLYSPIYIKAKKHHLNKEYNEAITCYLQAIANNERT